MKINIRFVVLCLALAGFAPVVSGQSASSLGTLHSFIGGPSDGSNPRAGLVQGRDGIFYGTTVGGGSTGNGTVFSISGSGVFALLHSFSAADGEGGNPYAGLVQDSDGSFYGTTFYGGSGGFGTVFSITAGGVFKTLHSFAGTGSEGSNPPAALVQGSDGKFYGATANGGSAGDGTVFTITSDGVFALLHSFTGVDDEGAHPAAGLVQNSFGNFFGTTSQGGQSGLGTVFNITSAGVLDTLYSFTDKAGDGANPQAGLVQGMDGNFYGTTLQGGTSGSGTVFTTNGGNSINILHSFSAADGEGGNPDAGLVLASDGRFYGTTLYGGSSRYGTMFAVTSDGVLTTLHKFLSSNGDGAHPEAGLVQDSDGNFYGTTYYGGSKGEGTIFKLRVSIGTLAFAAVTTSVKENAGNVTLMVSRTGGDAGAVSVNYASANGSASAGKDYDGVAGTLSWADGDSSDRTVTIPILDPGRYDGGTRTFSVALGTSTGGASLGAASSAEVFILDQDAPPQPTVDFIGLPATVDALSLSTVRLEAAVTDPAGIARDVEYFLDDVAVGGALTKAPFAQDLTVPVAGVYTIQVVVTDTLGRQNTATRRLNILRAPMVSLSLPAAGGGNKITVPEGSTVKVRVSRFGGEISQPSVVAYKVKGANKAGTDYKELSGSVTFPAGATSAKIKLHFFDDGVADGDKTLKLRLVPSTNNSYSVVSPAQVKIHVLDLEGPR